MGYCIVLGTAFYQSAFRAPTLSKFVLSALLLFLSARTIQRNAVWRSDFSLHEAGATEHPRNIKLMTNYGMLLHDRAKDTPENTRSEGERKQYYKDAEDVYKKGLKSLGEQRFPNLYFVYGNLYHETDRLDEAVDIYNLGLKKIDKTGTTLNLLNNLATIYYKQEKFSLSETAFKKAVEIKPEHWSSRNGLAVLYAATKRPGLAEIEFKAMLRMRPGYPEALFNYGTMLAADSSRFVDAKKLFQQVLKASPGHSGATSNLKYVEYKMNENS